MFLPRDHSTPHIGAADAGIDTTGENLAIIATR
jgi:hypothetical protein